jgi:predicted TIM-barrel fold metal-dependent hydrolase
VIIDAHTHLFERFEHLRGLPVDRMIEVFDGAGVDRAVVFTLGGLFRDPERTNEEIAEAAARFPDRLIPFATVNPRDGQRALDELERAVTQLGHRGVKLHPWNQSFFANSEAALEVARAGEALGVPFLLHSGTPPTSAPLQIAEMARVAPGTTFILGHMGLPDMWREAIIAADRYPNILLETCGAPTLAIRLAIERLGAERVVYGSDLPFGWPQNLQFQLSKIRDIGLAAEDERKVLGATMAQLLGIA